MSQGPAYLTRLRRTLPANLCVLAAAALLTAFVAWPHVFGSSSTSPADVVTELASHNEAPTQKPISEIRVGDRVPGRNPLLDEGDPKVVDPEPDTWRKLTLKMSKPDGHEIDIELLRPLEWIEREEAHAGSTIYLNLHELGAEGDAHVMTVEPCPHIRRGEGNVVTGTFAHSASNVIDLHLEGQEDPIGCTANHPFWSHDRQDFVSAGDLEQGEQILNREGEVAAVAGRQLHSARRNVYNLEVQNDHVYRVGAGGWLAHNSCPTAPRTGLTAAEQTAKDAAQGFKNLECDLCADAIEEALIRNGQQGHRILMDTGAEFGEQAMISSRKFSSDVISESGLHEAVQVDRLIFDNHNPDGILPLNWLNDLHIGPPIRPSNRPIGISGTPIGQ